MAVRSWESYENPDRPSLVYRPLSAVGDRTDDSHIEFRTSTQSSATRGESVKTYIQSGRGARLTERLSTSVIVRDIFVTAHDTISPVNVRRKRERDIIYWTIIIMKNVYDSFIYIEIFTYSDK